jgi:hypothetical protein
LAESPTTAIIWRRPALLAVGDQCGEQAAADAAADGVGVDVDGILHRVRIGDAGAIGAGIGVAKHHAAGIGDEPGQIARYHAVAAAAHFCGTGWLGFERGAAVTHVMAIDCGDGIHVGAGRRADRDVRRHPASLLLLHDTEGWHEVAGTQRLFLEYAASA